MGLCEQCMGCLVLGFKFIHCRRQILDLKIRWKLYEKAISAMEKLKAQTVCRRAKIDCIKHLPLIHFDHYYRKNLFSIVLHLPYTRVGQLDFHECHSEVQALWREGFHFPPWTPHPSYLSMICIQTTCSWPASGWMSQLFVGTDPNRPVAAS